MKQRWKRWASALAAVVLLLGLMSGCSAGQGSGGNGVGSAVSYEAQVVQLVNEIRAEQGLSELTTNSRLSQAAALRAEEIVTLFSHTRPNQTSCITVLQEFGVPYRGAGENIAAGRPTPEEVVNAWMNSPDHRANILNPNFKSIGVGYVSGRGRYGSYWVQLFVG